MWLRLVAAAPAALRLFQLKLKPQLQATASHNGQLWHLQPAERTVLIGDKKPPVGKIQIWISAPSWPL